MNVYIHAYIHAHIYLYSISIYDFMKKIYIYKFKQEIRNTEKRSKGMRKNESSN